MIPSLISKGGNERENEREGRGWEGGRAAERLGTRANDTKRETYITINFHMHRFPLTIFSFSVRFELIKFFFRLNYQLFFYFYFRLLYFFFFHQFNVRLVYIKESKEF